MSSVAQAASIPDLVGVGLRGEHEQAVLASPPDVGWLEVHSENYFGRGGRPASQLQRIAEHYPVSLHGIGLGLGNTDPLDRRHLQELRHLVETVSPARVSEHLCWNGYDGHYFSDLLPLPYTHEAAAHVAARIDTVQQLLGRQLLIENVSTYVEFEGAGLTEWAFLLEVVRQSGCGVLLDVNNVYVNACNHGFDPRTFLDEIPAEVVGEIHVAGHTRREIEGRTLLIDTHDQAVSPAVWALYSALVARIGAKPTLLERDANLPPLDVLVDEARTAERLLEEHTQAGAA